MQADQWPVVAIVGSGAVVCYFGGMLARLGVRVTLIGRARQMETIRRPLSEVDLFSGPHTEML